MKLSIQAQKSQKCLNCNDNNQHQIVEVKSIGQGATFRDQSLLGTILIILAGKLSYQHDNSSQVEVQAEELILIPPGKFIHVEVIEDTRLISIQLQELMPFCETSTLEDLQAEAQELLMTKQSRQNSRPHTLGLTEELKTFADSLLLASAAGIDCNYYYSLKVKELFYLIKSVYTLQELVLFFKEILSSDSSFYYQVKQNYKHFTNVSEFAAFLNMSLHSFEKQFKLVFNTTPYQWMNQKRSKAIFYALRNERTPLKELADQFGFSSKSSFSDFVKRNLGSTPGSIRKKETQLANNEQFEHF